MLKFINNLKINTRIALLSTAPLVGLAVIGGFYLHGERKIDEAVTNAREFEAIKADFDTIDNEVTRVRMLIRGIVLGSSHAQVTELKDAIMNSTQALGGTLRHEIDPAIFKHVTKLKTLVPKSVAQISKIEQANNKMGGTNTKGLRRDLDRIQNKLMALADTFGTDDVSRKIIEIMALANGYRYSGSFAADATSVENSTGGVTILFAGIAKLRSEIDGLLTGNGVSLADREKLGGLLDDYNTQLDAWIEVNSDFEAAMTSGEAIFGEINTQFVPIANWTKQQLAVTADAVQWERDLTKKVSASATAGVVSLLLLIGFAGPQHYWAGQGNHWRV
jgi:hypothetical protein